MMICLNDGPFLNLLLLFPDPDFKGHLQVRLICERPARDREHDSDPDVRRQCNIWGFSQQVQVSS